MQNTENAMLATATELECCGFTLEEIADAMYLLCENMEGESRPRKGWDLEVFAMAFLQRYSLYHASFNVLLRGLRQSVEDVKKVSSDLYGASRGLQG